MKTYYKNEDSWEFIYQGKTIIDTVQFNVLNNQFDDIEAQTVLFCIKILKMAEWIDDSESSNSVYNDLTQEQKKEVSNSVSYATKLFSETGNFDYLSTEQLMVWESLGATRIKYRIR